MDIPAHTVTREAALAGAVERRGGHAGSTGAGSCCGGCSIQSWLQRPLCLASIHGQTGCQSQAGKLMISALIQP